MLLTILHAIHIIAFKKYPVKTSLFASFCSLKTAKSEALNPKLETISKLQIQMFQTSFLISFI